MNLRDIKLSEIRDILAIEFIGGEHQIDLLNFQFNPIGKYSNILTFASSETFFGKAEESPFIKAIITKPEIFRKFENTGLKKSYFLSDNPEASFYYLHEYLYHNTQFYKEFEFTSKVGENSIIHNTVFIEDGVTIGSNVQIGPNVVIRKGTIISDGVRIKSNSVLGENGFMVKSVDGVKKIIEHAGGLKIGKNVEIGANCCLDRSLFAGFTEVGEETKIDNLVQISHNTVIGSGCVICADSQISGTVLIGDNTYIAPSVTIRDQVKIGSKSIVGQGAVVTKSIPENSKWIGVPARPIEEFLKNHN